MNLKEPHNLIATWFGLGLLPKAPGTWGSLGALPVGILILIFGNTSALVECIFLITVIGYWAADKFGKETKITDDQRIVVDEVAGQWIAMLGAGLNLPLIIISFVLFRLFDATKIGPVGWAEKKFPGAYGVMADDIVAGICALICLLGLRYAGLG